MATTLQRPDHGRAALAATLIAELEDQIPLISPARATLRKLRDLFPVRKIDIRQILDDVPGATMRQKAQAIGIPEGSLWKIARGMYMPSPAVLDKIKAAGDKAC